MEAIIKIATLQKEVTYSEWCIAAKHNVVTLHLIVSMNA